MSDDFTLDLSEFRTSFNYIIREHKKDVGPYLNKKALSVLIGSGGGNKGAVHLTPEASRSKINAVTQRMLVGFVCRKARKHGDWPLSREEILKRVEREKKRRLSAIAYTRGAGWLKAAKDLGGTRGFRGKTGPRPEFNRSKAAKGFGRKATVGNLAALLVNAAPAADKIGREALQTAVNNQARDMEEYAAREILKKFEKESAK